jgi:hypothetical protein
MKKLIILLLAGIILLVFASCGVETPAGQLPTQEEREEIEESESDDDSVVPPEPEIPEPLDLSDFEWEYINGRVAITKYIGTSTDVIVPYGVEELYYNVFATVYDDHADISITSISLPDSLRAIRSYVFRGCDLLSITIPAGVIEIEPLAFYDMPNLTEFIVSEDNLFFSSLNGVLFNKDKTELIKYPQGKTQTEYKIPDGVIKIGNNSFESAPLTNIIIPEGVTTLDVNAFGALSGLKHINLPDSITALNFYALPLGDGFSVTFKGITYHSEFKYSFMQGNYGDIPQEIHIWGYPQELFDAIGIEPNQV